MSDNLFMIKNVRCSFPHLFEKPMIKGKLGKCGITLLLNPQEPAHAQQLETLKNYIRHLLATEPAFKNMNLPKNLICLREGSQESRLEYGPFWILSTKHKNKPIVIAADGHTLIERQEDCPIYAGCRVNCKTQIWVQNNEWGKRINATPVAVQFAGDDEPLDGTYIPVEKAIEGFDGFGDASDAFGDAKPYDFL